ncbi:MAG: hypothetical protein ACLTUR_10060 [Paraclostridium sordellii]
MYKLTGSILFLFCGFFITQIAKISPFHISLVLSFILTLILILKEKKIIVNNIVRYTFLFIIYLILTQIYIGGSLNVLTSVIYSLIYLPLTLIIFMQLSTEEILNISQKFIKLSTMVLIIECICRIAPNINQLGVAIKTLFTGTEFYVFKYNSIMYNDSNFVAIFVVILSIFSFYLSKKYKFNKNRFIQFILFIICILTFSRAAILTLVCFYLADYLLDKNHIWILIIFIPIIIASCIYTINEISLDGSFQMKIDTILDGINQFKQLDVANILFGVGFNNAINLLGRSAHNFILTYLIETGIVGLTLIISLYIYIIIKSNYRTIYIFIPFIAMGMSFAPYALPYMHAIVGVIYCLYKKERKI